MAVSPTLTLLRDGIGLNLLRNGCVGWGRCHTRRPFFPITERSTLPIATKVGGFVNKQACL